MSLVLAFTLSAGMAPAQVVEYVHLDALGSIRAVTDGSGRVLQRHDYLPFGEEWQPAPPRPEDQPLRFTGKERDGETGLDYFGARYYGNRIARFTTVDPVYTWRDNLQDPQRWNRYAYANNNPLRYLDPDGNFVWPVVLVLAVFYVLNNPTRANVTTGPKTDTIVPNSVGTAAIIGAYEGLSSLGRKDPVTREGLERVERHLTQTPGLEPGPAEHKMLERLKSGERSPQDLRFYEHEMLESKHLEKTRSLHDDPVDAVRDAHHRALKDQGLYRRGYEEEIYHPDAIKLFENFPSIKQ